MSLGRLRAERERVRDAATWKQVLYYNHDHTVANDLAPVVILGNPHW